MSWDLIREVLYGLAPPVGVSFVFYVVLRAIIRADAAEREAERHFGAGDSALAPGENAPVQDRRDAADVE